MDDRRFDSLTRSLASGASRRSVLKGILGLGGAAVAGGVLLDQQADAARRPTPTPKPVTCPGRQVPVNGVCTCPGDAAHKCGPDCCTGTTTDPYPRVPGHSECCDNACCFGTCYGEELCCPTNSTGPESPPTHIICDGPNGLICVEGTCCDDSECGDPCQVCNPRTHTCGPKCDVQSEVCCTEQAGAGVCVIGDCCPGAPCGEGQICCQGVESTSCCPPDYTCENDECIEPCVGSAQIFVQTHGALEVPGICPGPFANVVTEVGLYPYANGVCSDTAIATATTSADGPASFSNITGGQYCALPTDGSIAGCLDCPNYGQGVGVNLTVPCGGQLQWTIGVDDCCIQGIDVSIFAYTPTSEGCNQEDILPGVELGLYDCNDNSLQYGPVTSGNDGQAQFAGVAPGTYCVHATAGSGYSGCESCPDYGDGFYGGQITVTCDGFGGQSIGFCRVGSSCVDGTCQSEPTTCDPGYFPDSGDVCAPCPVGTEGVDGLTCTLCQPGAYGPTVASVECFLCDAGRFADTPGSTECTPCYLGTYADAPGATACDLCAEGTYAGGTGAVSCVDCPLGTYAPGEGTNTCSTCLEGTYTEHVGSTSCIVCDCGDTCDPMSGLCPGGGNVGVGGECVQNSDCASDICGCGAPFGFPDCICRNDPCFAEGEDCSSGFGAAWCCAGDCNGNSQNGYFCIPG